VKSDRNTTLDMPNNYLANRGLGLHELHVTPLSGLLLLLARRTCSLGFPE
jgi:hypothetical protein